MDDRIGQIKKGREDRLKLACSNILSHESGLDFLIQLRKIGLSEFTPVDLKSGNETYYLCGRHSVMNEIMQMIRKHDFTGYLRLLKYEENLKQMEKNV